MEAWCLLVTMMTEILGVVMRKEAGSDLCEELMRGVNVENTCWAASRRLSSRRVKGHGLGDLGE